jgi:hypothetical protein
MIRDGECHRFPHYRRSGTALGSGTVYVPLRLSNDPAILSKSTVGVITIAVSDIYTPLPRTFEILDDHSVPLGPGNAPLNGCRQLLGPGMEWPETGVGGGWS